MESSPSQVIGDPASPTGIGGWLILPILGFAVSAIWIAYNHFTTDWDTVWQLTAMDKRMLSGFRLPLYISLIASGLVFVFSLFCLWCVFKRSHLMLFAAISFYVLAIMMTGSDVWVIVALNATFPDLPPQPNAASGLVRSVIQAAIWVTYFIRSERVENTFVN